MNLVNLLLVAFLNFLAPNKEPLPVWNNDTGLKGTMIDLARLAKGRILVCFIKEGMTTDEVNKILALIEPCSVMIAGGAGHNCSSYLEYGIHVEFTAPFGVDPQQYDPRVIRADFYIPEEYRRKGFWVFGKASSQNKQDLDLRDLLRYFWSDPNERMHELLDKSEDLRRLEEEWERIWYIDDISKPERVRGGIQ
jgi:hypothetical protein